MNFLSLFAGIGGIDLGLERAGMKCVAQVEIDPFCRRVLAKHWPEVPRFEDVRTVTHETLTGLDINVIAGGFPCQDISDAGRQAGIGGRRSGLWSEFYRLVCELRPAFVFVENVAALLNRGMGRVVGDLAACGYDAEWESIPAAALGAPHLRDRTYIVAYPSGERFPASVLQPSPQPSEEPIEFKSPPTLRRQPDGAGQQDARGHGWDAEPVMGRVADGIPDQLDRLRGLGNAVVPQVAEWIGRRIVEAARTAETEAA